MTFVAFKGVKRIIIPKYLLEAGNVLASNYVHA